jgi:hypothetical protein
MTREEYLERVRRHAPLKISYAHRGVALFDPVFLDSEQKNFGGGNWIESWYVIGLDTEEDDPIFIDLADPQTPVYTGGAYDGEWEWDTVTESVDGFFAALVEFDKIAKGPFPPSAADRDAYLAAVAAANPGLDTWYWEYLTAPAPA